jgi:hypothetical protein
LITGPDGRVRFGGEAGVIGRVDPDGRISKIALPAKAWEKLRRRRRLAVSVETTLVDGKPASRRYALHLPAAKKGA